MNYKLDAQRRALGAYCGLIAASLRYKTNLPANKKNALENLIQSYLDNLRNPLMSGHKQEAKVEILRKKPEISIIDLNKRVQSLASRRVNKRISDIKKSFNIDNIEEE